jgi:hypothetical protein
MMSCTCANGSNYENYKHVVKTPPNCVVINTSLSTYGGTTILVSYQDTLTKETICFIVKQ